MRQININLNAQGGAYMGFGEKTYMTVSKNWGPLFGSLCNKSPTIWGSILGPLIFGISHMGLPKIRVLIVRIIVYWRLLWIPPFLETSI